MKKEIINNFCLRVVRIKGLSVNGFVDVIDRCHVWH